MTLRAISLFAGAGGFECGFERAGIETVLQAENDPWCLSVLERHWPECKRVDDVRKVDAAALPGRGGDVARAGCGADAERLRHVPGRSGGTPAVGVGANGVSHKRAGRTGRQSSADPASVGRASVESGVGSIDLVYGGFPCQDLSVAGRRAGFRGERSSLWFEFERVVRELRPRWVAVENVPGLLSSHGGADFSVLLRGLVDLGYGVAWRTLDARHFGVPQRRRRVFIVGCLGDAARAQAVLAVCESCGGHPQACGEEREGVAFSLAASVRGTGDGHGNAWNTSYVADGEVTGTLGSHHGNTRADQAWTNQLMAGGHSNNPLDETLVAATLSGGGHPESNMPGRHHEDDDNLVVGTDDGESYRSLTARATGYRMDLESESFVIGEVAQTLRGGSNGTASHSKPSGTDKGPFIVADPVTASDAHHTLRGAGPQRSDVIGFQPNSSRTDEEWREDQSPPVKKGSGGTGAVPPAISGGMGVRRLTPLECERLMGWPDEHTRYTAEGKQIPDSHRYRMCGNGVVATVAEWLGHRIVAVDRWIPDEPR